MIKFETHQLLPVCHQDIVLADGATASYGRQDRYGMTPVTITGREACSYPGSHYDIGEIAQEINEAVKALRQETYEFLQQWMKD